MQVFCNIGFHFNVIMLTETWYSEEEDIFGMPNYTSFFVNGKEQHELDVLLGVQKQSNCECFPAFRVFASDVKMLTVIPNEGIVLVSYRPPGVG